MPAGILGNHKMNYIIAAPNRLYAKASGDYT